MIEVGDPNIHRDWYSHISGGAGCPSLSKGASPLVPGATEHQQKASRPRAFRKACLFGPKVLDFEHPTYISSSIFDVLILTSDLQFDARLLCLDTRCRP